MGGIATLVGGIVGGKLIKGIFKKKPKAPEPVLMAPPSIPRENSAVSDALLARRGSRTNQRTGSRGVEAPGGGKTRLGT